MGEEQRIALHTRTIHYLAWQYSWVDVGAFEPFMPVALIIDDPALNIFLPQGRAPIDAQTIETESVQLQPGCKAKTFQDVLLALTGRTHQEKTVGSFDPMPLGFAYCILDLLQGLVFMEPIQHFLRAGLNAVRQEGAVGLTHDRQLIDSSRIHPALASPAEFESAVDNAMADFADARTLEQEVIIGKINRAVTRIVELLHFSQDVLCRAVAPFAVGQRRNVAVNATVGAAPRRLNRAEFIE